MPRQKNTRPTLIYWLVDTRTNTPFYCGKTVESPSERLRSHRKAMITQPNRPISRRLAETGEHVRMQLMEIVPVGDNWAERERHWIRIIRFSFPECVNVSAGGQGAPGMVHTAEARAKQSAAIAKRVAEISANLCLAWKSPAYRSKMIAVHTGKKRSAETRAKQSAAAKLRRHTTESRAKLSAANKGKKLSVEHRAKISAANTRRHAAARAQNA